MMQPRTVGALLLVMLLMILTGCGGKIEPPYVGAFYLQAGALVEIPQSSEYPVSVGATDPTLDDLAVIYVKYPLPSIEDLVLQRLPLNDSIPATIDIKDDMVYELKPRSELADGDYCLVVADGTKSVENLTRWCFSIGARAIYAVTEVAPTAAVPTEVAVARPENAPHWKLLAFDLHQAPGNPGWTDYKARLAYQALVPLVQGRLEVGGGYVLTAEGNQYPAMITRAPEGEPGPSQFNPERGISTLYYQPGIPVGHVPGVTVHGRQEHGTTEVFWLSFRVPESLTPISVHFPGFEPIDLDTLPVRSTVVLEGYRPNYVLGDPIQVTSAVTMRLGSPHYYQRQYDGMQVLAFDVELANNDLTADRQVAFIVSMVDGNGVLRYTPFISCSESSLHYSFIGYQSFSTLLGPGQTQEGVFCVLPYAQAKSAGPFVVILTGGERYTEPGPSVYTFILDVDPETGTITVQQPRVLTHDPTEEADVAASEGDLPTCDKSAISPGQIYFGEGYAPCAFYVMNADGTNRHSIPHPDADSCFALPSPGGEQILYVAWMGIGWTEGGDVYVMDAIGSNLRRLTENMHVQHAFWTPDGHGIMFQSGLYGNHELYVMDKNGANMHNLTNIPADDEGPRYSPDGSQIAFKSNRDGDFDVYVMDRTGGNVRKLTHNSVLDWQIAWSPSGSEISFTSDLNSQRDIYVMSADGSNLRNLTQNAASENNGPWSPDGRFIAFDSWLDESADIYVIEADGSNLRNVSQSKTGEHMPVWSPDGRYLAFTTYDDGSEYITVASRDGSNRCRLTDGITEGLVWVSRWLP